MLKKSQWYYICDCGFRIGHTVAKVPLSEDTMQELFTTGKTKQKVTGFVSKAGNPFDAVLKYIDEKIVFDFDNSGENKSDSTHTAMPEQPWLAASETEESEMALLQEIEMMQQIEEDEQFQAQYEQFISV